MKIKIQFDFTGKTNNKHSLTRTNNTEQNKIHNHRVRKKNENKLIKGTREKKKSD